jgi:predicted protein tyrosine phosphatase
MNVLFVCSRNRRRSATAEAIFADLKGINTLSAGTSVDAVTPLTADLIEWADLILAMETVHRRRLRVRFGSLLRDKRIGVLGIPDKYEYGDAELIRRLRQSALPYLHRVAVDKN